MKHPGGAPERLEKAIGAIAGERYVMRLYVSGNTARSARAIEAIRAICELHLVGRYELEIVDLRQAPERARQAQVVAAPTLVKELPLPLQRLIGDLADRGKVLVALNIGAGAEAP